MNSASIVLAFALLISAVPRVGAITLPVQDSPPSNSQNTKPATPEPTTQAPAKASKPCPVTSASPAAPRSDCKTPAKKHRASKPAAPGEPDKKIVRNGSTTEPSVDISPKVSDQQASQEIGSTAWLLDKTEENLKAVETRQLSTTQQDTVNQIKIYVEQSKTAARDGDVQRSYNLANKARMLSGDLVKH